MNDIHPLLISSVGFDITTAQFKDAAGRSVLTKALLSPHPLKDVTLCIGSQAIATGETVRFDDEWYEIKFFRNDVQLPLKLKYMPVRLETNDRRVWPNLCWVPGDVWDEKSEHVLQNLQGKWNLLVVDGGMAGLKHKTWCASEEQARVNLKSTCDNQPHDSPEVLA